MKGRSVASINITNHLFIVSDAGKPKSQSWLTKMVIYGRVAIFGKSVAQLRVFRRHCVKMASLLCVTIFGYVPHPSAVTPKPFFLGFYAQVLFASIEVV